MKVHISVMVWELFVEHAQEAVSGEFTKAIITKGVVSEYVEAKNLSNAVNRRDKGGCVFC